MSNEILRPRRFRFTKRLIETLPAHHPKSPSREMEYSDVEVTGLRLLVSKNGRRFFYLRYRYNGRKRVIRIGEFPATSLQDARQRANEFKNMLSQGIDPLSERDKVTGGMTFQEFGDQEYLPHAKSHKKSWRDDQCKLQSDMYPVFGNLKMSAITGRDIEQYCSRIKGRSSPGTSNRHLSLLKRMFNLAIQWQILEKSPCVSIKKYKENGHRERYLNDEEIRAFLKALEHNENRVSANALQFLLFTGLRLGEAMQMEWKDVDLTKRTVFLSPQNTKSGKGRTVILNDLAVQTLEELQEYRVNKYVFPGKGPQGHLLIPRKVFESVKKEAKIGELRIHDLRHTYASLAVNTGSKRSQPSWRPCSYQTAYCSLIKIHFSSYYRSGTVYTKGEIPQF